MTDRDATSESCRHAIGCLLGLALVAGCSVEAPPPRSAGQKFERGAATAEAGHAPAAATSPGADSVREWLAKVREFGADETSQRSSEICSQAADAIDEVGIEGVPVLAAALRSDPAWHVREFAAFALGRQARDAVTAVPALLDGLRDANFLVTEACDGTLGTIADTGPAGLTAVATGLDSDQAAIRGATAELLGAVGPSVAAVLPRLEALAQGDQDASVRATAAEAVKAIGGR